MPNFTQQLTRPGSGAVLPRSCFRARMYQSLRHAELTAQLSVRSVRRTKKCCRLLVDDVNQALIHRNVQIAVDDSVVDWLLKKADEEANSGARPLRRPIQRHIEDELSEFMIRHKDNTPDRIEFSMDGDEVVLLATPKEDLIAN